MLTRNEKIICDYCGQFISYANLMDSIAAHNLITPDSEITREEYESYHHACAEKAKSD